MIEHQLTNPDWNLIRLAIVIIDVAAVALVVVLWGFAKAWWRRAANATARGRSGRPARYADCRHAVQRQVGRDDSQ